MMRKEEEDDEGRMRRNQKADEEESTVTIVIATVITIIATMCLIADAYALVLCHACDIMPSVCSRSCGERQFLRICTQVSKHWVSSMSAAF